MILFAHAAPGAAHDGQQLPPIELNITDHKSNLQLYRFRGKGSQIVQSMIPMGGSDWSAPPKESNGAFIWQFNTREVDIIDLREHLPRRKPAQPERINP
jgi:hypothetical protein